MTLLPDRRDLPIAARAALLQRFPGLLAAWMFGSAATGSLRADSETDYAELMDATLTLRNAARRDGVAFAP